MTECLSRDEIKYWVERLLANEYWGWKRDERLLAQTIGFDRAWRMRKYLYGDWNMSVKLQREVSALLQRVISGEIVCERKLGGMGQFKRVVSEAVIADNPQPLVEVGPARAFVIVGPKGVKVKIRQGIGQRGESRPMPSFKRVWENL